MKKYVVCLTAIVVFNTGLLSGVSAAGDISMGDIIKKTREMYNSGVDKKVISDYVTKEVDKRLMSTNNDELFENPLNWFRLLATRNLYTDLDSDAYNDIANVAWTTGLGNCQENSSVVYYILKKAGVKEHVRILRTAKHSFTVWGIQPSAKIDDPTTWGDEAIVVDPWLGKNLSSEEVLTNKWFMDNDPQAEINDFTTFTDDEADSWDLINSRYNREHNIKPEPEDRKDENIDCFIATAVYGTPRAPEIQILRTYRDKVLRPHIAGRLFIIFYESFSPPFACLIKNDEKDKLWVRKNIVEPSVKYAQENLNSLKK